VAASAGRPKKPSAGDRLLGGSRTSMAFLAGVLLTLPSAMYLAALKDIAQAAVSTQEESWPSCSSTYSCSCRR
jgi:hypothetical protein